MQYSHDDPATAAQLTSAALQKDPDLVGIFATNLFAAEGSATGLRQAGKAGEVKIVGFDAGPNQVKALKEGTVQALVAQQPATIGQYGVDAAVAALDGTDVPRRSRPGSPSSPRTTSTATAPTRSTSPSAERPWGRPTAPAPRAANSKGTHERHRWLPPHPRGTRRTGPGGAGGASPRWLGCS